MSDAARLRDSTQIQLPSSTLDGIEPEVAERFDVTVHRSDRGVRLIGSPVVIKDVGEFLARRGVSVA
jgi:hypothetical protein